MCYNLRYKIKGACFIDSREQKIKELIKKISEFKDEDFGELLECPKPDKKPEHIPPKNVHPRLYFTKKRLDEIRAGLLHEENKYAYELYVKLSETECDGVVRDFTDTNSMSHMRIIDSDILTCLSAKAFRYALTGDELYGYEAVAGALSYMKTFDLSNMAAGIAHYSTMRFMSNLACIYDWCYDLLADADKHRFACGMTKKCCKYLEYPDFLPMGGSLLVGHMSGTIFFVAWASVGISLYDEHPEYYDITQAIVQEKIVPAQNLFMNSGENPQGCAYGPARENSLLFGDITNAYDEETVSEAKRYMFSLHTGRDDNPLAFFVYDRVTAVDESYKKTVLLHMQARPLITKTPSGNRECAMITNLSSRLYVQSVGTAVEYSMIGGEGKQFNANGVDYERTQIAGEPFVFNFNVEEGWGRIEIIPKTPAKTDCMLTVMYIAPDVDYSPKLVLGESNILPFREVVEIKGDGIIGTAIIGNAAIFPEHGKEFECKVSFTIPENSEVKKCYIIGMKAGEWRLSDGRTVTVGYDSGIAEFELLDNSVSLEYIG